MSATVAMVLIIIFLVLLGVFVLAGLLAPPKQRPSKHDPDIYEDADDNDSSYDPHGG